MPGAALTVLAVVLLTFAMHLTVTSHLRYQRAQQTAQAEFRGQLAEATAPVGQTGMDGQPLALGTPVAVLEIPALGTRQVVLEGTTSGVLQDGPGHRRDTALPGQPGVSLLMGRRAAYGAPFAGVHLLNVGDAIVVTTGQGRHEFTVRAVCKPGDPVPALAPNAGRVTLMTAGGPPYLPDDVVRVHADLRTQVQEIPTRVFGFQSLPAAEKHLAGDSSAWVQLVLWGQLLLLAAYAITWAWARWGGPQAWAVGVPVLAGLGLTVADQVARLLPNLL